MNVSPETWARISEIFDAVRSLPPSERTARLDHLCGGESAVRLEVESLLDSDDDSFLAEQTTRPALQFASRGEKLIGETVGAYQVEREIGRGGMGVVYEGHHSDKSLAKRVAIKTLAIGMHRPELVWRFRREREILAKLDHPNIAALYDGGTTDRDVPFLVMEYVEGVRIDVWCAQQRLSISRRIDLFRQVCAAVQFAHTALVVHRDLKPGNMLVTKQGTVKLLDFGVAKLVDTGSTEHEDRTVGGVAPLTTAYASPEQLRGEDAGTSSDIYSLGVVLYRLLTGAYPYDAEARTPSQVLRLIDDAPPTPPSERVTETTATEIGAPDGRNTLRSTLEGELDAIVLMALRHEPTRRYATVDALSEDLLRYLKGLPVQARPDTMSYRVRKFVRRQPALVAGIAVAALALVGATVTATRAAGVARASASVAQAETQRARNMNRYLQAVVGSADQNWYSMLRGGKDITVRDVIDSMRASIPRELSADPVTRADLYRTLAGSYHVFNQVGLAIQLLDSAERLHSVALGAGSSEVTRDMLMRGYYMVDVGQVDSAVVLERKALHRYSAMTAPADTDLAFAQIILGQTLAGQLAKGADAIPLLESGSTLESKQLHPRWQLVGVAQMNLGVSYLQTGEATKGDSAFAAAIRAVEHDSLRYMNELGMARSNWGILLGRRGAHERAVPLLRSGKAVIAKLNGPSHFNTAVIQSRLADELRFAGGSAEGRALVDSALAAFEAQTPSNPAEICVALKVLSAYQVAARDFRGAARTLARARTLLDKLGSSRDAMEVNLLLIAADLEAATGSRVTARTMFEQAAAMAQKKLGPSAYATKLAQARLAAFMDSARAVRQP
jgi:eukaryotic-like serine/threonine-protein kinase